MEHPLAKDIKSNTNVELQIQLLLAEEERERLQLAMAQVAEELRRRREEAEQAHQMLQRMVIRDNREDQAQQPVAEADQVEEPMELGVDQQAIDRNNN
ncbi:hypothetical protein CRE_30447 [Caenorhabditis remanei]|uniref:Uncharacterized protein n=2 Tax=Caenorhabditis remanei TaxID=31234 RepID=E3NDZ5_CAERE|nr:hypothetical protein CRE_30447 [Caenorhabditis remanei]